MSKLSALVPRVIRIDSRGERLFYESRLADAVQDKLFTRKGMGGQERWRLDPEPLSQGDKACTIDWRQPFEVRLRSSAAIRSTVGPGSSARAGWSRRPASTAVPVQGPAAGLVWWARSDWMATAMRSRAALPSPAMAPG